MAPWPRRRVPRAALLLGIAPVFARRRAEPEGEFRARASAQPAGAGPDGDDAAEEAPFASLAAAPEHLPLDAAALLEASASFVPRSEQQRILDIAGLTLLTLGSQHFIDGPAGVKMVDGPEGLRIVQGPAGTFSADLPWPQPLPLPQQRRHVRRRVDHGFDNFGIDDPEKDDWRDSGSAGVALESFMSPTTPPFPAEPLLVRELLDADIGLTPGFPLPIPSDLSTMPGATSPAVWEVRKGAQPAGGRLRRPFLAMSDTDISAHGWREPTEVKEPPKVSRSPTPWLLKRVVAKALPAAPINIQKKVRNMIWGREAEAPEAATPNQTVPFLSVWNDRLTDVRKVGEGSIGTVYRCRVIGTDREVAVKVCEATGELQRQSLGNEVTSSAALSHSDLITIWDTTLVDRGEEGQTVFFLMEAADCDLARILGELRLREVARTVKLRFMVEILRGLKAMSDQGFIHRDVKPENMLVIGDSTQLEACRIKIADFGSSFVRETLRTTRHVAGTRFYMAPEVWAKGPDMTKSDVWSAGIVLYQLFIGALPKDFEARFNQNSDDDIDVANDDFGKYIVNEFDVTQDEAFQDLKTREPEVAKLIAKMLTKKPFWRIGISRALRIATFIAKDASIFVSGQKVPESPFLARAPALKEVEVAAPPAPEVEAAAAAAEGAELQAPEVREVAAPEVEIAVVAPQLPEVEAVA